QADVRVEDVLLLLGPAHLVEVVDEEEQRVVLALLHQVGLDVEREGLDEVDEEGLLRLAELPKLAAPVLDELEVLADLDEEQAELGAERALLRDDALVAEDPRVQLAEHALPLRVLGEQLLFEAELEDRSGQEEQELGSVEEGHEPGLDAQE